MGPIREVYRGEPTWFRTTQEMGQDAYELRVQSTVLLRFCYHRFSDLLTPNAEAETAEGRWLIVPDVLVRRSLQVYRGSAVRQRVGVYTPSTMRGSFHGALELSTGQRFHWLKRHSGIGFWEFTTLQGKPLLGLRETFGRGSVAGTVIELSDAGRRLPELPLLAVLSCYLRIEEIEEEERLARRRARRQKATGTAQPA